MMFEIDKEKFGSFLAAQRKENGFTQKELAEKLFLSDKAVSKWERGLSLPDITLLMPLAELLGITVTELLEGRRIEDSDKLDAAQIENLVKKALVYPENLPEKPRELKKKHWLILGFCTLAVILECAALFVSAGSFAALMQNELFYGIFVVQLLSLGFGVHFWITAKEQLPSYYDENKISCYSSGMFEMNFPGVCFNNRNWCQILRVGRIWTVLGATVYPACCAGIDMLLPDTWVWRLILSIFLPLAFCDGGLFIPMYYVCKKYT
ncbi:MAG: helix-turn-helix domain-containing protein [Eubacterium sp.]|nr:helix-turn-helix domain-containing protein [Eubacterium sp.]